VIFEVFRQEKKGAPFTHAGSVVAPDATRRALGAVGVFRIALEEFLGIRIEHGRAAIDRGIHKAELLGRHAAGGDEPCGGLERPIRTAAAACVLGYSVHFKQVLQGKPFTASKSLISTP
jgi:hypothetical protein